MASFALQRHRLPRRRCLQMLATSVRGRKGRETTLAGDPRPPARACARGPEVAAVTGDGGCAQRVGRCGSVGHAKGSRGLFPDGRARGAGGARLVPPAGIEPAHKV